MLLKELVSPVNGLFSNMPKTIWGENLDPTYLDVELFTRIGNLEASPLVEFYTLDGVLDTEKLSSLLYQRYSANWQRIWDALAVEYNIMLTTTVDETRTTTRDSKDTETRDLTDTQGGSITTDQSVDGSTTRSGSIARSGDSQVTRDLTDLETRNLTGSQKESGTEGVTDTFDESNATNSTLSFTGSEKTTRNEDETTSGDHTLAKSGSESTKTGVDETRNLQKKNTGTVGDSGSETQTGTGSTVVDSGKYGIGSTALANESRESNQETRNFTNTTSNTRTDNTTETDSGTIGTNTDSTLTFNARNDKTTETGSRDLSGDETKTFTDRSDKTVGTDTHTGTVEHETTFGKQVATSDGGTVSNKTTGTEGTTDNTTETYNALKDAHESDEKKTETRELTDKTTGTIDSVGTENATETFHSEGSSPLRTFQALITEEIQGRSGQGWNFTDIVIRDVQTMIASKIWRRNYGTI